MLRDRDKWQMTFFVEEPIFEEVYQMLEKEEGCLNILFMQ